MVQAGEELRKQPLFGGAISIACPARFEDVSDVRPVPDHQEVYTDGVTDQSFIVEILVCCCGVRRAQRALTACSRYAHTTCTAASDCSIRSCQELSAIATTRFLFLYIARCMRSRLQHQSDAPASSRGRAAYWAVTAQL